VPAGFAGGLLVSGFRIRTGGASTTLDVHGSDLA